LICVNPIAIAWRKIFVMINTVDLRPACQREWLALVLAAWMALFAMPGRAEDSSELIRLAVGGAHTVALSENPSTGYRWRMDEGESRDLALVAITDAGYTASESRRIGAPGVRRFTITARRPGTAVAVFEYARPWERVAPARRHVVTIEIGAR
jgi:predicted secreted protein